MADITRTKAKIGMVYPEFAEIHNGVAASAIEAGQPLYIDSNGKFAPADANDAAKDQFRGIALEDAGAGQAVSVLVRGHLYGYTFTQAYDAEIFVSNNVGELADGAGGTSLSVGRVVAVQNSKDATKVLYVTGIAG
jgi:hypothetical protein